MTVERGAQSFQLPFQKNSKYNPINKPTKNRKEKTSPFAYYDEAHNYNVMQHRGAPLLYIKEENEKRRNIFIKRRRRCLLV